MRLNENLLAVTVDGKVRKINTPVFITMRGKDEVREEPPTILK